CSAPLSEAIIRPVFSMIVFSVVFGGLAKVPSDGIPYPIFSYAALLPWTYFSTSMTSSTGSLIANAGMLTKVYFPRIIIPFTPVLAGLVDFVVAFSVLAVLMIWYGITPTWNIIFLPLLASKNSGIERSIVPEIITSSCLQYSGRISLSLVEPLTVMTCRFKVDSFILACDMIDLQLSARLPM
ncbi:ABC transporter permease, partial [Thermodesulfobacteriota bacterium]